MLIRIAMTVLFLAASACSRTIDTTIHDAAVTAAVKTALLNDAHVDGTLVTVRSEAGVVYLGGTQPSVESAAHVVAIVRTVSGVRDVESSISVEDAAAGPHQPEQPQLH